MDEFLIILKVGILVFSLFAMLSFQGEKSHAKKTTKELLDEDFNEPAKAHELDILRDVHHINTSETVYTAVIQGDLEIRELTTTGMGGEQLTTIGGVMVELPYQEIIHYLEQTEFPPENIVARVAVYDGTLYVLSLQDYWLGEGDDEQTGQEAQYVVEPGAEFDSESSERTPLAHAATTTRNEPEPEPITSNVEILGDRPANEVEQWHFDPPKAGYGWAISVVVSALAFIFFMSEAEPQSAMTVAFIYLFITVILVGVWIKRSKRTPKPLTITKLRGEIESINDYLGTKRIRFQRPTNWKKYDEYVIPEAWLDKVQLNKVISFEVCAELNQVVSVQPYYSVAESAKKTNPSPNLYMRYVGLSLALSGLMFFVFMGPSKLSTMFGMLSQPETVQVTKRGELLDTAKVGQRVAIEPLTAVCSANFANYGEISACTNYALFDSVPVLDYEAISEPFIVKLWHVNSDVPPRKISDRAYLRLYTYAKLYGKSLESQYNIISVNKAAVAKWAKWVEINPTLKGFKRSKEELVRLWQSLEDTESCESEACWQAILAHDLEDKGESEYLKRHKISDLMAMKAEAVDLIIGQWIKAVQDATKQVATQSSTVIHLVNHQGESNAWNELREHRGYGNTVSSDKLFKRYFLEDVLKQVEKQQLLSLDYGVVSDVVEQDNQTNIYIDTDYTEDKFTQNLTQLALAVGLVLFGLVFGLLAWMDARALRSSNSSKQTAWVS